MRPTKTEYFMSLAELVASRSTCIRRQYGAVIVNNGIVVSTGYNGSPKGDINCCDVGFCQREADGAKHNDGNYDSCHSVHAEQNAMLMASREEMDGAIMYLAGFEKGERLKSDDVKPCPICQRMIDNSGIIMVIT